MFLMVSVVIFLHQFTTRLILKADHLPLRMVYARLLESFGKICIIPIVFLYFIYKFPPFASYHFRFFLVILVLSFSLMVATREYTGLRRTVKDALVFIRFKIEKPSGHELSTIEVTTFNYFTFGVWSRSAAHFHRWKKEHDKKFSIDESVSVTGAGTGDRSDSLSSQNSRRFSTGVGSDSMNMTRPGDSNGIAMYDISDYYKKEDMAMENGDGKLDTIPIRSRASVNGITRENEVVSTMHEL